MARSAWSELRGYLCHPLRRMLLLSVIAMLSGLAEAFVLVLVVASSVRVVTNRFGTDVLSVLPDMTPSTMLLVAALLGASVVALHWWSSVLTAALATEVQVAVQHRLIGAFLGARWSAQSGESTGLLQESVTVQASQAAQFSFAVLNGVGAALQTLVLLATALVVSPLLALVVVGTGVVLVVVLRPFTRSMTRRAAGHVRAHSDFTGEVSRLVRMAMEFRAFGVGPAVAEHLRLVSSEAGDRSELVRRLGRFSRTIYRDVAMLLLVAAVFVMTSIADLDLVAFGSVVLLVVRAVNSAQSAYESAVQRRELAPYLADIGSRAERLESDAEPIGERSLGHIDVIELRDVGYGYVPGEWAVRHLDLRVVAGEVVGVVGPSGGGKSTLVQLLTRLRRPEEGTITVNGIPYGEISEVDWAAMVALVPQEPDLMEASVADNIVFWRSGVTRADVEEAARQAHISGEILQLPSGFDTELGADGQGLSGGQKQRIAIARALAARPCLLVLDEPTSALDGVTEALIRDTIGALRGSVTVIVVAHRPSTLEVCDRIVTIDAGAVVNDVQTTNHG